MCDNRSVDSTLFSQRQFPAIEFGARENTANRLQKKKIKLKVIRKLKSFPRWNGGASWSVEQTKRERKATKVREIHSQYDV